ncbi:serine hydrolase [Pueribacillus theae]|uniref:serine hydrolase n=1 Tax=Pueribacillus theae TaxID=2171751 RepID=UPI00387E8106
MVKKLHIFTLLSVFLFFGLFSPVNIGQAAESVDVNAEAAILIDAESGKILYEKEADKKLAIASMTKMMTEYLVLDAIEDKKIKWDQEVKVSDYAQKVSQNNNLSNVPLLTEVTYTVKELYEAMAIYSANGATIALAELVSGSEADFVKMMNEKAKELGLDDAKFVNTTGLNNKDLLGKHPVGKATEENMMSARSTARLAYELLKKHPNVLETASIPTKEFTKGLEEGKAIKMKNWNWMLKGLVLEYPGVDGLKTGSTKQAGYSFTGTVEKDGMRFISVIMKTNSDVARFRETAKLFDWAFSNFSKQVVVPKGYQFKKNTTVPVVKGKEKKVEVEAAEALQMIMKNNEKDQYEPTFQLDKKKLENDALVAPLKKGQKVGTVSVKYKGNESDYGYITGEKAYSTPLVTKEEVKKANWFTLGMRSTGSFFGNLWDKTTEKVKNLF